MAKVPSRNWLENGWTGTPWAVRLRGSSTWCLPAFCCVAARRTRQRAEIIVESTSKLDGVERPLWMGIRGNLVYNIGLGGLLNPDGL
ncbi:hypothetical protein K474DRAFT_1658077 [Panus rudis PR-1116 ss-1]|nr:hypothetical protein K474DRAFT_1658077 [Panus rudis PR-1116 ss-1]